MSRVRVGDVLTLVKEQVLPSNEAAPSLVVGLADITPHTGRLVLSDAAHTPAKSSKFKFKAGDLLFGKLRPELRKCVVADQAGLCSTDILVLRPVTPGDEWFLNLILRGDELLEQIRRRIVGASLPRVRSSDLLDCKISWPVPSVRIIIGNQTKRITEVRETIGELETTLSLIQRQLQLPEHHHQISEE